MGVESEDEGWRKSREQLDPNGEWIREYVLGVWEEGEDEEDWLSGGVPHNKRGVETTITTRAGS